MKTCRKCGETKGSDQFYSDRSKQDGRTTICRVCVLADRKAAYADPAKRLVILGRNRASQYKYYDRNKTRREETRLEAIEAYGGKCVCCGEAEPAFLTFDHIHGDGAEDRKANSMLGSKVPYALKKLGWPKDRYQLLCWNCNCAKGIRGGCPHERQR